MTCAAVSTVNFSFTIRKYKPYRISPSFHGPSSFFLTF